MGLRSSPGEPPGWTPEAQFPKVETDALAARGSRDWRRMEAMKTAGTDIIERILAARSPAARAVRAYLEALDRA